MNPQSFYMPPFLTTLSPKQTPFSTMGVSEAGYRFYYLTNRRYARWSYLMTGSLTTLIDEAYDVIPMGYNQLWIFERILTVKPQRRQIPDEALILPPAYPKRINRAEWPGRLYVVLKEPTTEQNNDVLAYHLKLFEAIEWAQQFSLQTSKKTVVGLMLADMYWH